MIRQSMDVLQQYPIRKSKSQKLKFRDDIISYFEKLGYRANVETGLFGSHNIVVGDPHMAKYLVTAHYDTPAAMTIPNMIIPCHVFPFILWQIFSLILLSLFPAVVGVFAGYVTNNSDIGFNVCCFTMLIESVLMLIGPSNKSNANDNTSGVVTLMEVAGKLPRNMRYDVCFVLFDLEEAGMLGSAGYAKKHSHAIKHQIVLNLDCVGDGDYLTFIPSKKFRNDVRKMKWLCNVDNMSVWAKTILIRKGGFLFYPSDQVHFPYGVGISALSKTKRGWLYCDKIHTRYDSALDEKNVEVLSNTLVSIITSNAT